MADPFAVGLTSIRSTYAWPVLYTGAGLAGTSISAIKGTEPADAIGGMSAKGGRTSFEIAIALLPGTPRKTDTIEQDGVVWRVDDINQRDDIDAWLFFVKR